MAGRHVTMIGGNAVATFRAGIKVDGLVLITFMLAGAIAGVAGWLLAIRTSGALGFRRHQHVGVHQCRLCGRREPNPTYEQVSGGRTGYAEAVQVTFDPRKISLGKILQIFFSVAHDPTQLNRQGPDAGTQYRSAIFFSDETEKRVAQSYIAQLDRATVFRRPIVTRIDPLTKFYPAEAYHQNYALTHPHSAYIVINDLPKVDNLKRLFPDVYREQPVTVATMAGKP
jgi:methionine-S-sulfoxide reductase